MSKFLRWLFGGLFTILLVLLGIEKANNKKKNITIVEQATAIKTAEKQADIQEAAKDAVVAVHEGLAEIEKEQRVEEEKIEEAKTDEEVIAIANDIVGRFNAR
ncbi:MAG: hypothetical protein CVV52_13115 [Spirochaetae bacterium HGW-Spirochaetae-8]|jgi:hypothetical protein|nr:MAG: hypothetical protein CVV52_13115 [Spirochaetae bacterium HGW-Spirochaetae-8]